MKETGFAKRIGRAAALLLAGALGVLAIVKSQGCVTGGARARQDPAPAEEPLPQAPQQEQALPPVQEVPAPLPPPPPPAAAPPRIDRAILPASKAGAIFPGLR
jgi:hypothetical protein